MALAPATYGEGILGLEATHWFQSSIFPGIMLNDIHGGFPRYRVRRITGLRSLSESDDAREPVRGNTGELAYPASRRGRTVVYEGVIQALTLESLRAATTVFVGAFSDAWREASVVVRPHPGRGGVEFSYLAKALAADVDDEQTRDPRAAVPGPYERAFSVSLRQSDPRYFSTQLTYAGLPGQSVAVTNPGNADSPPLFTLLGPLSGPPRLRRLPVDPPNHDRFIQFRDASVWGSVQSGQSVKVQFGRIPTVWWEGGPPDGLGRPPDLSALVDFSSTWWNENSYDILPGVNQVSVTNCAWQVTFPAAKLGDVVTLKARIEDLAGEPKALLMQYTALETIEPLNDSMSASVMVSMYDPAVQHIKPLERVLSITYGGYLVFRGRITRPIYDFGAATVQINAHDPTLILKHHYHTWGDEPVESLYPIDGRGTRMLVESATPKEMQYEDEGAFPSGILYGTDSTTHQAPYGSNNPDGKPSIWRTVERGTEVWESVQNLSNVQGGPDFWFRPVGPENPGRNGVPPKGFFCELNTYDERGTDRRDEIIWEAYSGRYNADNVIWEPDGDQVRNYWVQVYPGGERSEGDDKRRARVKSQDSIDRYGLMVGWESSGQKDAYSSLVAKAKAWVRAYAFRPDYFTVLPSTDRENVPQFRRDYNVGDVVTARSKRGYVAKEIVGRVVQARMTQQDANAQTKVELECVPRYAANEVEVIGQAQ